MVPHIQLTEVAKANFTTVKVMKSNNRMEFYDNLLQVTIGNDGMIFDLDSEPIMEVNSVENIDQLAKPDSFTNTGCIMSISTNALHEGEKVIERVQVFTNENANLLFEKRQKRFEDGKRINNISGMLYRSFSELDLQEMNEIHKLIAHRKPIRYIDPEAILCNFDGHTIFSLFFDRIAVYE